MCSYFLIIIIIVQRVHDEQTKNKLRRKNSAVCKSYRATVQSAEIIIYYIYKVIS